MALNLKKILPTGENQLVNYNFVDIATGTGYANYYAGTVSGANILSNIPFYSNTLNTDGGLLTNAYVKEIDKDFDVKFILPQNINGDAIVDIPCSFYDAGSGGVGSIFIIAKIRKWDGSIETEIAQGSSPVWTAATPMSYWNYNIRTVKIPIPMTHFKKGEYLRLTIEAWAHEATQNNLHVLIYHDPMNRSSCDGESYNQPLASGASILKLQLPIKIDI
jgi:hypothetical protein